MANDTVTENCITLFCKRCGVNVAVKRNAATDEERCSICGVTVGDEPEHDVEAIARKDILQRAPDMTSRERFAQMRAEGALPKSTRDPDKLRAAQVRVRTMIARSGVRDHLVSGHEPIRVRRNDIDDSVIISCSCGGWTEIDFELFVQYGERDLATWAGDLLETIVIPAEHKPAPKAPPPCADGKKAFTPERDDRVLMSHGNYAAYKQAFQGDRRVGTAPLDDKWTARQHVERGAQAWLAKWMPTTLTAPIVLAQDGDTPIVLVKTCINASLAKAFRDLLAANGYGVNWSETAAGEQWIDFVVPVSDIAHDINPRDRRDSIVLRSADGLESIRKWRDGNSGRVHITPIMPTLNTMMSFEAAKANDIIDAHVYKREYEYRGRIDAAGRRIYEERVYDYEAQANKRIREMQARLDKATRDLDALRALTSVSTWTIDDRLTDGDRGKLTAEEWSRRVREGVAAIDQRAAQAAPMVVVQSDVDEDD